MNCTICKGPLNTGDPLTQDCGGDCLLCMAEAGDTDCMPSAVAQIRPLQRRFAEHLEAWRVNNQTHAARIAELERALGNAIVFIDGDEYDITDLVDVRDGAPK